MSGLTKEQKAAFQAEEHYSTVKIKKVQNGFIVRVPFKGEMIFATMEQAFECLIAVFNSIECK